MTRAELGLQTGTLPGGWYLRALITGDPPALYARIGPAMQALAAVAAPADRGRPLVEYYRRRRPDRAVGARRMTPRELANAHLGAASWAL